MRTTVGLAGRDDDGVQRELDCVVGVLAEYTRVVERVVLPRAAQPVRGFIEQQPDIIRVPG